MEELKIDKIIISKQGKNSENYENLKKIAKKKKIKIILVKKRRWNKNRKRAKPPNPMAKRRANTGKYIK